MRSKKSQKKKAIVIIALLCLVIISKMLTWDNIDFLFFIAGVADSPSVTFNLVIERIYKLAEKKDVDKIVVSYLRKGKNQHLDATFARTLGVIGNSQTANELVELFILDKNRDRYLSTYFNVITALGLIGNDDVLPILEKALDKKEAFAIPTSKYLIARSLYLCTGKSYKYVDEGGETTQLIVTDELKELRHLIEASKGRKRTFDEMIAFESLFRPPPDIRN